MMQNDRSIEYDDIVEVYERYPKVRLSVQS